MRDQALRAELLAMAQEDGRVRDELAAEGTLVERYHPRMEEVHQRNAQRLGEILDQKGWPGRPLVGADGATAAWLIAQHAIGEPAFQRRCLQLLQAAAARQEVPAWHPAMLEDRIRMFEGRPQLYGTQLEPDEGGFVRPYWLEDPTRVEELRRAVGLEPLADLLAHRTPIPLPKDRARWLREYEQWLRRVGWR